jgi:ferritin-like metal-binding protein YciE
MTTRPPYKKRLQEHLSETKRHAREVQRRIKALGGKAEAVDLPGPDALSGAAASVTSAANKAVAAAKGPLHMIRGTGEQEKLLRNARTEFWNEAEEIAMYTSIEALADTVGDKETAKLARSIRREEEKMQNFLERLIPQLTKAVAREEIPASERSSGGRRSSRRSSSGSSRSSTSSSRSSSSRSRASSSRSSGGSKSRSGGTKSRSSGSKSRSSGSKSRSSGASKSRSSSSSRSRSTGSSRSGSSARKSSSSRSSGARKSGGSRSGSSRSRSR